MSLMERHAHRSASRTNDDLDLVETVRGSAVFDRSRTYRYLLTRVWDQTRPSVIWVMLNPSLADAHRPDPTLRRVVSFSGSWGFGSCAVMNLFALITPEPERLNDHSDPIGSANDDLLRAMLQPGATVVAAWGASGGLLDRDQDVRRSLRRADVVTLALGTTRNGAPRHPLYLPGSAPALPWDP